MAVGPDTLPELHAVEGFRLGTASAGIKKPGRRDLVVMELAPGSVVAGVFTRNAFCAAPVQVARRHLELSPIESSQGRYFVVNTGNANAGTGEQGIRDAEATCLSLADLVGVDSAAILPFSTGVIGEPLPLEKIQVALPQAVANLSADGWAEAAAGIMTTDTRPKAASRCVEIDGVSITVTGIAKGAGMIKPNMATMLAYIATDASLAEPALQQLLGRAADASFNRITVDGDTSTNDACMLVATGCAALDPLAEGSAGYAVLEDAITAVCIELAQGLVRDGEGASKFVTVEVGSAATEEEALAVAFTIAESPLVKTALYASDPNWGRLLAAIGRSGIKDLDVNRVQVSLNGVLIAERGCRAASYTEEQGVSAMSAEEIVISVALDRGDSSVTVWTTDLSYEYIRINAEYRT